MEQIRKKAYAKVNLALDVLRRREDGYHEVKMVMQTVDIYDELILEPRDDGMIRIETDAEGIPTDEGNLIHKSAKLLIEHCSLSRGVNVRLYKRIPAAAGMAGGSTDAAATLLGMNELFELGLSEQELMELGMKVGADVPYCIMGGTALAEGIGERLTRLPAPPRLYLCIAKPDIDVSTKYVYDNLHADELSEHPDVEGMIRALAEGDVREMGIHMENVLETVTLREYPVIEQIKRVMKEAGAVNALMSGSGPTVFGIFETSSSAEAAYRELGKSSLAKQLFLTIFTNA